MEKPKFQIGDEVWMARCEHTERHATCPDCGGTRFVTVIANGDTHTVPCAGCSRGWESPSGVIPYWEYMPKADRHMVAGVTVRDGTYEYRLPLGGGSSWVPTQENVFATEEEAINRAKQMKVEMDDKEQERISKKKEEGRTWAWHVHYYRREIRDAQERIERATKMLSYAQSVAKEPKS